MITPISKSIALSIFISIVGFQNVAGQDTATGKYVDCSGRYMLSEVPQYFIKSGLRLDLDYKIANNQWLVFGPQLYYNSDEDNWNHDYDRMIGFGLNAYHKIFLLPKDCPRGVYVAYGVSYQQFFITTTEMRTYTDTYEGMTVTKYGEREVTEKIYKPGISGVIGYQFHVVENLFMDMYLGWGFRHSFFDHASYDNSEYVNNILSMGYRGITPVAAFRLSVLL
jgi:hypothetical protein